LQSAITRGVGQRGDTAVIGVATTVEHDLLDPGFLRTSGDQLADLGGLGLLVALETLERRLLRGGRDERVPLRVVDHLSGDVPQGTADDQTRAFRGTENLLTDTRVPLRTGKPTHGRDVLAHRLTLGSCTLAHAHLPVFPTFRRMFSPA